MWSNYNGQHFCDMDKTASMTALTWRAVELSTRIPHSSDVSKDEVSMFAEPT